MKAGLIKIYEDILHEKYQNFVTTQQKTNIVDQIWNMLEKAYQKVGGFKSSIDKNDLINGTFIWKVIKKNGKIKAVVIAKKTPYGRKPNALATDGSLEGMYALIKLVRNDISQNNSFFEVSGPMEKFVIERCKLEKYKIPSTYAELLTQKKIDSYDPDGYHYIRNIHGQPFRKMLVGNPKITRDYDYERR